MPIIKLKLLFLFTSLFIASGLVCQIDSCMHALPFCSDSSYILPAPDNNQEAETGPDYGCLGSQPNPTWRYLFIDSAGTMVLSIGTDDVVNSDLDFACWGPFDSMTGICDTGLTSNCTATFNCYDNTDPFASYPSGNLADCSYDAQSVETCTIQNAVPGKYYVLLITNFASNFNNLIFYQTNAGQPGAGHAACSQAVGIPKQMAKDFTIYPTLLDKAPREITIESPSDQNAQILFLNSSGQSFG